MARAFRWHAGLTPLIANALPSLSPSDQAELTALRRALHQRPELSGEESETAAQVVKTLNAGATPDALVQNLGGHGVAAIYEGAAPGPTVMLRCELDGLPIQEVSDAPHRSQIDGKGHLCGHDGHMTMLIGAARLLARQRPAQGRVVLLFQPAEETGAGAAAVLADPAFAPLTPDLALSLHNLPGLPLGNVMIAPGSANCASVGLRIALGGRTAHASMPEDGLSPTSAIASMIATLADFANPTPDQPEDFALTTITHVKVGAPAFGVAPGAGELWVTLRTTTDTALTNLRQAAETAAHTAATKDGLTCELTWHDHFHACTNDPEATSTLIRAMERAGLPLAPSTLPMRFSEDFGLFGSVSKAAMFYLGAGTDSPALHNPDYDFPDALIEKGVNVFVAALDDVLGFAPSS